MATAILSATKCVIYCRFSDRPDAENCTSNETQLHYCREYARANGYEIVAEHGDAALSGGEEDRPGLWAAMGALKRNYRLIAHRYDRLARNVYLDALLHREAASKGAKIEVVDGSRSDSPQDTMVRQIIAAVHEYERKAIAARISAAMLYKQNVEHRRMSRFIPYGFNHDGNGVLLVNDTEMDNIIRLKSLSNGGMGPREICRQMDAAGLLNRGRPWRHSAVQRILSRVA